MTNASDGPEKYSGNPLFLRLFSPFNFVAGAKAKAYHILSPENDFRVQIML